MVEITTLRVRPTDPVPFEEHYAISRLPLAEKIPNVQRFEAGRIVGMSGGGEPPYYRIAEASVRRPRAAWAARGVGEGRGHPNFTPGAEDLYLRGRRLEERSTFSRWGGARLGGEAPRRGLWRHRRH